MNELITYADYPCGVCGRHRVEVSGTRRRCEKCGSMEWNDAGEATSWASDEYWSLLKRATHTGPRMHQHRMELVLACEICDEDTVLYGNAIFEREP